MKLNSYKRAIKIAKIIVFHRFSTLDSLVHHQFYRWQLKAKPSPKRHQKTSISLPVSASINLVLINNFLLSNVSIRYAPSSIKLLLHFTIHALSVTIINVKLHVLVVCTFLHFLIIQLFTTWWYILKCICCNTLRLEACPIHSHSQTCECMLEAAYTSDLAIKY